MMLRWDCARPCRDVACGTSQESVSLLRFYRPVFYVCFLSRCAVSWAPSKHRAYAKRPLHISTHLLTPALHWIWRSFAMQSRNPSTSNGLEWIRLPAKSCTFRCQKNELLSFQPDFCMFWILLAPFRCCFPCALWQVLHFFDLEYEPLCQHRSAGPVKRKCSSYITYETELCSHRVAWHEGRLQLGLREPLCPVLCLLDCKVYVYIGAIT